MGAVTLQRTNAWWLCHTGWWEPPPKQYSRFIVRPLHHHFTLHQQQRAAFLSSTGYCFTVSALSLSRIHRRHRHISSQFVTIQFVVVSVPNLGPSKTGATSSSDTKWTRLKRCRQSAMQFPRTPASYFYF